MPKLTLARPKAFSLAAAIEFHSGFLPGSGMARAEGAGLTLAFRLDDTFEAVAVSLHETDESIVGEVAGTEDVSRVAKQVARMLGLDADAEAWLAVGERDLVVGRLQAEFPGFFTAAKPSPYDAAAWGVIVPRTNMRHAAELKMGLARAHGERVELGGVVHSVFPSPAQLLAVDSFPGLSDEKLERLKGIAMAALEGKLGVDRLCAMSPDEALADLQSLRGVGPWTASHIYFRGAAPHDGLPTAEPRVLAGLAEAYGLASPTMLDFERIAEAWRPFRMWVSILLVRHLARAGGWNRPGLTRERQRAGRALRSPRTTSHPAA